MSILDPHADFLLGLLGEGKHQREIAALLLAEKGIQVSHVSIGKWLKKMRKPVTKLVTTATSQEAGRIGREMILEHFGRVLDAAESGYERTKASGDEMAASNYLRTWEKTAHDLAGRFIASATPSVAVAVQVNQGGELRAWAEGVIHGGEVSLTVERPDTRSGERVKEDVSELGKPAAAQASPLSNEEEPPMSPT